jgi:hypothetical protein
MRQCDGTVLYPKARYAPKADREETAAPRLTRHPFTMPVRPRGSNARASLSQGRAERPALGREKRLTDEPERFDSRCKWLRSTASRHAHRRSILTTFAGAKEAYYRMPTRVYKKVPIRSRYRNNLGSACLFHLLLQEKIRPKRLRFRHLAPRPDRITLYIFLARLERRMRV